MKTICFYFQIHQPFRLKRYRFFDIGNDHYYYDDFQNEEIIHRIAEQCYLPANRTILEMIKTSGGKFKVAFSISGVALEQMEIYTPEVIDSFKELAATGNVEFLSETYAHSLSSLGDPEEFKHQVKKQEDKIKTLFGVKPKVFRNTELIYSDDISAMVSEMGYKGMLTEGAKHILGWKSPNYMYSSCVAPKLSLLLKNDRFSEDLSNRFSDYSWNEYPLTADKYMSWIAATPDSEQIINLFMNYEVLGSLHPASTGIFEFFKALPRFAADKGISFSTPSEVFTLIKPVDSISVPYPISWVDEERDCSSWLGNVLQQEAFRKINEIGFSAWNRGNVSPPFTERREHSMSLYGNRCSIGGLSCGMVLRGAANGEYRAVFERESASLEEIEGIRWDRPQIQGECILPTGYGFTVRDIQYSAPARSYTVVLQVAEQYLGDVVGYQSQVAELEDQVREGQEAAKQNERLRELLDLQAKREDFVFESARVTGRSTDNWASTLTISKGTSAGVEAGDCVVTSTGVLVGVVSKVGLNWSTVSTIINTDIEIGGIVTRTYSAGVLEGDFALMGQGRLKLSYLPHSAQLVSGDEVLTSGKGDVYLSGLVVKELQNGNKSDSRAKNQD